MVHLSQKLKRQPEIRVGAVAHTLQRQRQCQRQTERLEDAFNQRPPAAHPVRPSTSMINCRSMHFKNVNLSYMPRSIRLSPKKETDRQRGRQTGQGTDGESDEEREVANERKISERKCFRRATEIKLKMYNRQMRGGQGERERKTERDREGD